MDADWIRVAFRPDNIQFNKEGMTISLLRTTGGKLPFSGSEFQRRGYYGYGRYEGVLRASPGYGAVSSFFTYTGPPFGDPHDEIDFEFLGRSPREVHTNYFKNGDDDAVDIPLWFDATQDHHLYVIYWTPDSIRWIIDGHIVRVVTAKDSKIGIPSRSGKLMANIWTGNGGTTQWTGVANFSRASTSYRCIAHVPLGKSGPKCSDTFKAPPVR
jgi:beta-glucanase (GH16 family)